MGRVRKISLGRVVKIVDGTETIDRSDIGSVIKRMAAVVTNKETPQSEPILGREKEMVENNAGGFVFTLDPWNRLDRFLILGSVGGTYYATEKTLTLDNAKAILDLILEDGPRVVAKLVEVSEAGRAPKNEPAILALALCCKMGNVETKQLAYQALPKVCRIGTHLFQWAEAIKALGGFSSGTQRALARWYQNKDANALAYQVVKYQQREGWSHRDLLRLSKPGAKRRKTDRSGGRDAVLTWVSKGTVVDHMTPPIIAAFEKAKSMVDINEDNTRELARLINETNLPRECVPTQFLNDVDVWQALLDNGGKGMPIMAMIRNLGKMSSVGLLKHMSTAVGQVVNKLTDRDQIKYSKIHPLGILTALATYKQGKGMKGGLTWNVIPNIMDALDEAFYLAFGNVERTGLRYNLALDVSGSMGSGQVAGSPLTPREASAALSMVSAHVEPMVMFTAFSHQMIPLTLSKKKRLDDVVKEISGIDFGSTNCALPMLWAQQEGLPIDVFVVYTDNETWVGSIHPIQALDRYKQKMGVDSKLVVVGMTSTGFTIADPKRKDMLDVVGMDTNTPQLIGDFALGRV